jgi:D-alanyl-lipoteichoic acid acyltransferase DltB (MBOAT superfamily)
MQGWIAWGGAAWIFVTLGAMALMIVLINTLTRPRMMAVGRAMITEKGPVSSILRSLTNDPLLLISNQTRLAITLGIVFLMTIKPGLGGSLLTIATAIVLGLAFSLPTMRQKRAQEKPAD